ncbi:Gamma-tubulin complex component 2 [Sparganum proliferum]
MPESHTKLIIEKPLREAETEQSRRSDDEHSKAFNKLFGQSTNDAQVLLFAEQLEKHINPHVSSQLNVEKAKQVIVDNNPNAEAFLTKYNELKLRNDRASKNVDLLLHPSERDDVDQLQRLIRSQDNSYNISTEPQHEPHTSDDENTYYPTHGLEDYDPNAQESCLERLQALTSGGSDSSRKRSKQPLKLLPQWIYERPYLSLDYFPNEILTAKQTSVLPLETLPLNAQEKLIVQDILACLQGNDGAYIKALPLKDFRSVRNFAIDEKMHPSLLDTVKKILPLCSHYSTIVRFVEERSCFEYGQVIQALCEGIECFLRDYWILLCQLERQYGINQLGISRLLFLLQETGYLFTHVARLVTNISTGGCTGGAALSLIHESLRSTASLDQVHDCMVFLMRSACAPFFEMLKKWIYRGVICDPYGEFFITAADTAHSKETRSRETLPSHIAAAQDYIDCAFFWDQNYTIVRTQLPAFLEARAEKILKTGKYLNVVQQCDNSTKFCDPEEITFSETDQQFIHQIDRAHAFASKSLLQLIINQRDLKGLLKSVKRYFLLDQADFIVHFMDAAASELRKPSSLISVQHLESLLELALRTSSADSDPYKDNLRVSAANCDLITQMLNVLQVAAEGRPPETTHDLNPTGLEAFSLDYKVDWPVSLVINRLVLDRYQMLFRHLFYCRHVERHLSTSWAMRKAARRANTPAALKLNSAFVLSQRMLTYIQHFQCYMTFEVIEPTWHQFFQYLDKADNIDDLLDAHMRCLEVCLDDCLLTSPDLLAVVGKLNVVCVNFANFLNKMSASFLDDTCESMPMSSAASMMSVSARGLGTRTLNQQHPSTLSRGGSTSSSDLSIAASSTSDVRKKVAASDLGSVVSQQSFTEIIDTFDNKFNTLIVELLSKIRRPTALQRSKLLSLAARLDFNNFYMQYPTPSRLRASTSLSDFGRCFTDTASLSGGSALSIDYRGIPQSAKPGSQRPPPTASLRRIAGETSGETTPPAAFTRPRLARTPSALAVVDRRSASSSRRSHKNSFNC